MKDNVIWLAIGFNVVILFVLLICYIFNLNETAIQTFQMVWFLSFGWLCGRISRL